MKVVREIIWYLNGRRLLGPDDLTFLRRQGFIDFDDEAELKERHVAHQESGARVEREPDLEDIVGLRNRHRRARRKSRPSPEPMARKLSERVLALWPTWEDEIRPLLGLARHLGPAADLGDALSLLRQARPEALDRVVVDVMTGASPSLPRLWSALAFEAYRHGIVRGTERGPAVVAYRALLHGKGRADLGAYAALLRHPGLARLHGLIHAQRAILASVGRVLASAPAAFDRPLFAQCYDPVCYWALTIVVSGRLLAEPSLPLRVHAPARPFLISAQEAAAVRSAALIDVAALSRLCAGDGEKRVSFRCPVSWDLGYFRPSEELERAA